MSKKKEVAVVPGVPAVSENQMSVENLLSQAVQQGASVETMERLMAMRRELKAEFAKAAFDKSMADFQNEVPTIKKTVTVKTNAGAKAYSYAPLESIVDQVKKLLNKHGFSYAIQTKTEGKEVIAICVAKHIGGYSESSEMKLPLGNKTQVMSDTQVTAAALTFAKRYAFCNAFGILTGDADTNAQPAKEGEPGAQIVGAIKTLRAARSLGGLEAAWKSLSQKMREDDEVEAVKDELKAKYEN